MSESTLAFIMTWAMRSVLLLSLACIAFCIVEHVVEEIRDAVRERREHVARVRAAERGETQ